MVPEARLEPTEHGLVPRSDGWLVVNAHVPSRVPVRYREGWLPRDRG